ncbi:MAG: ribose-phosphate pyrophosphokinase [Nitrospiraceae bacterium]|jgi:ribose-phosphate pyrophosphokinase|nr:MAG: ribose-phosphate pyrophosphokinase [Nitrospiraceae bacterium]
MPEGIKIFAGNSNAKLANEIADVLNIPLGKATVSTFSDGEITVHIDENVRGSDVYVVQSTCTPVNNNLMELLLMVDALKRASARRITAVMPYYGYARQDRKAQPRVPISARLVADLLTATGINRVLTIDLHAGQIQGFFDIPVDHLYAAPVLSEYVKDKYANDVVVVSPDAGGVERARAFAKRLDASLAIIDKRREKANVSQVMHVIGEVSNKNAILFDDMIDTAGTITQAAAALKENGAKRVIAACAHAVLSGPALDRINDSVLEDVIVTNTIPMEENQKRCSKLTVLTVAKLLGEAIKRINEESSVSSLFD